MNDGSMQIAAGADPDWVLTNWAALTDAAYYDSRHSPRETTFVTDLLAAGADPNRGDYPPLFNTINQEWSSAEVFAELVAAGADIHARAGWEDETVLHRIASICGLRPRLVDLALDLGADIEALNGDGETPLFAASGNEGTLVRLIARGANLDARDCRGRSIDEAVAEPGWRQGRCVQIIRAARNRIARTGSQTKISR